MPSIWGMRAFRAWLILAVPLSLLFAYLALSSHFEAARAKSYAQDWYERDLDQERKGIPKGTFSQDPKIEMRESYRWMADAAAKRDNYALYAAILVLLAPAAALGLKLAAWVWRVPESKHVSISSAWPKWLIRTSLGVAGIAGFALVFSIASDRAIHVLVSTLVQVVGVSLIAWLVSKLRK